MSDANTPILSLQEVYDGKNHYMPSFFRIKLGVMADFMDVPNIPFGSFAAFFHEYVHYLQDVTTLYGLMNLGNVVYYVRDAAARVGKLPKGEFEVPISLDPNKGDAGYQNSILRKLYNGSSINPKHSLVDFFNYDVEKAEGSEIEKVVLILRDRESGVEFNADFGGNVLTEGMAFMAESWCNQKMYEDNGLEYPYPSEYPYMVNGLVAKRIYPEFAKEIVMMVALADLSLLTFNCGLTYIRLLEHLKEIEFMQTVTKDNYVESIDRLYDIGHKFINWDMGRFQAIQNQVLEEVKYYFKMPIALELNDWISRVWEKAYELRQKAPHYITDIMLCNEGNVRSNRVFCEVYLGLGTPLIINGDDEGAIVPPQGFNPSKDFMPGLYWAIEEIARIFSGSCEALPCQLKDYCIRSNQEKEYNLPVDGRCDKEPWLHSNDVEGLCPVGAIWKHWSLQEHWPKKYKGTI
jgi:hypothetical protein